MTRIDAETLRQWSAQVLATVGLNPTDASHIARCLVDVDLRGIRSHGTRQLQRYVREFRDGHINPSPVIELLHETSGSVRFHGDGGAGYLVAARATDAACDKAASAGIVLASTCNHGHVGSAGIYGRRVASRGYIGWCVAGGTGWQRTQDPGAGIWDAMKAPPMCFAVPAADGGPPLILDMNANQFGSAAQAEAAIAAGFSKSVFGSLGMRFVSTLLGGALAGTISAEEPVQKFSGATRGFLLVVIDPAVVGDAEAFRAAVRHVIDESMTLAPMAGTESAAVAGALEWQRESEWAANGIPIPDDQRDMLDGLAMELGLDLPDWHQS